MYFSQIVVFSVISIDALFRQMPQDAELNRYHQKFLQHFQGCTLTFPDFLLYKATSLFDNRYYYNELYVVFSQTKFQVNLHLVFKNLRIVPNKYVANKKNSPLWQDYYRLYSRRSYQLNQCKASIVAIPKLQINLEDINITSIVFPEYHFMWFGKAQKENIYPDYLIILTTTSYLDNQVNELYLKLPEFMASTRLFAVFFDTLQQKCLLQIGCFSCLKNHVLEHYLVVWNSVVLKSIAVKQPFDLNALNVVWINFHRKLNNFGGPKYTNPKQYNDINCFQRFKLSGFETPESDCTTDLMHFITNCTISVCVGAISFGYNLNDQKYNQSLNAIPFGVEFQGYKYAIVLGLQENQNLKYFHFENIFLPFSYATWILFGISLVIIYTCFLLSQTPANITTLWLISVIFEQGDDLRKYRTKFNITLICFWLYATILLRHFYVSKMYSNLTKEPEATNLPQSFGELFVLNSDKIFQLSFVGADVHIGEELNTQLQILNSSSNFNPSLSKLEWKIFPALRFLPTDLASKLSENMLSSEEGKISCGKINTSKTYYFYLEDMKFDTYCFTHLRFAFIYKAGSSRIVQYLQTWLQVYSGRNILESVNQPMMFSYPLLWTTKENYFFIKTYKSIIAALDQSGIAQLHRKRYEIFAKLPEIVDLNNEFGYVDSQRLRSLAIHCLIDRECTSIQLHLKSLRGNITDLDFINRVKLSHVNIVFVIYFLMLICCTCVIVTENLKFKFT